MPIPLRSSKIEPCQGGLGRLEHVLLLLRFNLLISSAVTQLVAKSLVCMEKG